MPISLATTSLRTAAGAGKKSHQPRIGARGGRVATQVVAANRRDETSSAILSVKSVAVAGIVALQLAASLPALADAGVFNDRASQKAAILAAARAKAAAGAAMVAPPPDAPQTAQFKQVEGFMDKDVRTVKSAERAAEEGEAKGVVSFGVTEPAASSAAAETPAASSAAAETPAEEAPENGSEKGGLFGMFN